jgi:hypothetical protein
MDNLTDATTPLVQMPIFLIFCLLMSLGSFIFSLATRQLRAYRLGPILGRGGAILMSWLLVMLFGAMTIYFLIQLAHHI